MIDVMKSTKKMTKEEWLKFRNKEQQWEIFKVIEQSQIPMNYAKSMLKEKYNVDQTKQLTTEQADEFIDILKCCSVI